MSFTYNSEGLIISKTVNGATSHYVYDGNVLIAEYTDSDTIVYIYDVYDSPIGFKYRSNSYATDTWDVYWYGKNIQGDILHVYDDFGTKLVSYTYTAWGVTTKTYSGSGASTTAVNNNLTYRGYYYDSDLGMYYLQSRYYDPIVCRFINADIPDVITASPTALTDKNLFAYCDNNPVMRVDEDGEFWANVLIGAAVGAVAGAVGQIITDAITSVMNGEVTISNWQTYVGATVGGISSGIVLATTGNVDLANAVCGAVTTGTGQILEKLTIEDYNKSWAEIGANIIVDGAVSYGLGKLPGIEGVTSGRNSWSAVYKSGLTKLKNGTASRMSAKVLAKGVGSSIASGFALDVYYGIKQHAYDRVKNLFY